MEIKDIKQFMDWCAAGPSDGSEERLNTIIPDNLPVDIKAMYELAHS